MKNCPRCDVKLKEKKLGSVEIDECDECKGIWFDKGEFKQAETEADPDLRWIDFEILKNQEQFKSNDPVLPCPVCEKPMARIHYGEPEIKMDCCASCDGVWLEKGEFKNVIEHLERDLLKKSFSDYVKESVKEAGDVLVGSESFASEWKDFITVLRLMKYRLFVEKPGLLSAITGIQKSIQ